MSTLADVWSAVRAAGITLTAEGDGIRAEPRGALTDTLRTLIRSHRVEILADLRRAQLLALVDRVARHSRCSPEEVELMKRGALADPEAAMVCFLATVEAEGIA